MPKGKIDPANIPDDGLTIKQRRSLPITAIHTGPGKGKSTAAFGMALRGWNNGFNIGVFQFVKSKTWNSGEEAVFKRLGQLHDETGVGGAVEWQKLGEGWSWLRKTSGEEGYFLVISLKKSQRLLIFTAKIGRASCRERV